MLSQGMIGEAKHMGDKLGVGSSQPGLHFDNSGEALLEVLKEDIIERPCNPQRVLVHGIAKAIPAPFLAIVRSPCESRCRST